MSAFQTIDVIFLHNLAEWSSENPSLYWKLIILYTQLLYIRLDTHTAS